MDLHERHDAVVQQLAAQYEARGYAIEMGTRLVDDDGTSIQADLIARRGADTILVEAKHVGFRASSIALRRYAELAHRRGWRFVIAVFDIRGVEEVEVASPEVIRTKLDEARAMPPTSTAAPLMAWSVLEAAGRLALARHEMKLVRLRTPVALIQDLAAVGLIDASEEHRLHLFSKTRNRLAHGFWDVPHDPGEVEAVLKVADRLVDEALWKHPH